ncbi:hypothetical protein LTR02_017382 [Friedmanniomyces endolithicus]|nr:hypothetical protein LTR94_017673 [Friedmanniomyces endolithicus]KAK0768489.1 hypothetical protein LTR59_017630 [Friedmanniomyces endolithicus]KAK0770473.1 hypothetical protein LTR38_017564 [Friedmanniomyces endolithicus]KAK0825312.1 hypothetical protein LTR03_017501 [Friedmanniomyces endolithicus]KAK0840466.1 hypothetical protein LTS02_017193 [Friedmanniomyces endolithicus]
MSVSPRAQHAGAQEYGTRWLKALYRGYTNDSFTTYTQQPPWQGTQGPTIRAEVGDLVEILFVNKLTNCYATMHSMGLMYTKYNGEGADYPNNIVPGANVVQDPSNAVPPVNGGISPGDCTVQKWMVGTADGPPEDGYPAQVHSYHSYVTMQQDTNASLIGPTMIYAPGMMNSTISNYREIPLLYMVYNEADSWLSAANKAALQGSGSNSKRQSSGHGYAGYSSWGPSGSSAQASASSTSAAGASATESSASPTGAGSSLGGITSAQINNLWSGNKTVWQPQIINLVGYSQFSDAPSFYTMNGYIFANNPTFEMCLNDKVIWYVNAYGSASHVFHMHGNGFAYPWDGTNNYAVSLNNGVGKALYMNFTGVGKWQVICHVNNHQTIGMVSNYEVYKDGQCPLPALG